MKEINFLNRHNVYLKHKFTLPTYFTPPNLAALSYVCVP